METLDKLPAWDPVACWNVLEDVYGDIVAEQQSNVTDGPIPCMLCTGRGRRRVPDIHDLKLPRAIFEVPIRSVTGGKRVGRGRAKMLKERAESIQKPGMSEGSVYSDCRSVSTESYSSRSTAPVSLSNRQMESSLLMPTSHNEILLCGDTGSLNSSPSMHRRSGGFSSKRIVKPAAPSIPARMDVNCLEEFPVLGQPCAPGSLPSLGGKGSTAKGMQSVASILTEKSPTKKQEKSNTPKSLQTTVARDGLKGQNVLEIQNVPNDTTLDAIVSLMEAYGKIKEHKDFTKGGRRIIQVQYADAEGCDWALDLLQDVDLIPGHELKFDRIS